MSLVWRCPVCLGELQLAADRAGCQGGHHFDRARQGYFNLLLANQKSSPQPGDSPEMLANRRRFLDAGYFAPLQQALAAMAVQRLAGQAEAVLLDSGCGEGSYSAVVQAALEAVGRGVCVAGIDIAKAALKLAAKRYPGVTFAVASGFALPLMDQQVDLALRVFAPANDAELFRVIKPGGWLLVVSPGPDHLIGLKRRLYPNPRAHDMPVMPRGFVAAATERLEFTRQLSEPTDIKALLSMMPFFWRGSPQVREALMQAEHLTMNADFLINIYRRP